MPPFKRRVSEKMLLVSITMLLSALLATTSLQADTMLEQDVAGAVETWLRQVITDARTDARVTRMEPHRVDGETVAYVAHLADDGFCLCGADDLLLPVYLYVPEGSYDAANPGLQHILGEIETRLDNLRRAIREQHPELADHRTVLADRAEFWRDLSAGLAPDRTRERSDREDPFMMLLPFYSMWGQGSPYNDQCPAMPFNEPSKVGCVATAASQVMYYWQWPETGEGSHHRDYYYSWRSDWDSEPLVTDPVIDPINWGDRLQWIPDDGGQLQITGYWDRSYYGNAKEISPADSTYLAALEALFNRLPLVTEIQSADFGATTYDWSLMSSQHFDPVDEGDEEVAKLCYHVGIAINTYWGRWSSSSNISEADNAFKTYFRYDEDAFVEALDTDRMTEEIQWLRPVYMAGNTPTNASHAFVATGYDKAGDPDRLFWINLGWGGTDNGWYACDDVDLGYTEYQHHVTHLAPEGPVRFVGGGVAGDGSPASPYADLPAALTSAPDGSTLMFKAGTLHSLPAPSAVIDRPLILKGHEVIITGG